MLCSCRTVYHILVNFTNPRSDQYIHNLKDLAQNQTTKGKNPFAGFTIENASGQKVAFDTVVPVYDPHYSTSTYVYDHIKNNIAYY